MVDTDIAIYVDHRLQQHNDVGLTDDVRETIRNAICTKGQGSFLYARLMMDKLLDDTTQVSSCSADLDRFMRRLPVSLEDMYNEMLLDHATRSGVPQELQLTILQWVTHSVRPLRLLELAAMIDSRDDSERKSKDTKALVRTACGPLLEILEDETVSIIHHSFTEFLIDPVREGRSSTEAGNDRFPVIKTKETHRLLAATCLKYLTSGRLAEWKLMERGKEDFYLNNYYSDSRKQGGIKMLHPFLDYAISNICAHVAKLESSDKALFAALDDFMKPSNHEFVSWIDLTWTGYLIENISALHIGAYWGMGNYCQHLMELGHLDINGLDGDLRTPISWVSRGGHVDVVKILLQNGATADPDDKVGLKPLHYAAMANQSAVVRLLLAAGVDPLTPRTKDHPGRTCGNAPSAIGHNPLMYACNGGGVESVLEFMTYLSADDLNRALGWAVSADKANVVIALLESPNISIDSTENDRGSTALYCAAEAQNPGMIRALLEKGADPNARSRGLSEETSRNPLMWGLGGAPTPRATPLHAVTGRNCRRSILSKEDALRECCELLIDAGGDFNAIDENGKCPIHYCKYPAITSILLRQGSNANVEGSTPLHFVCEKCMDKSNRGNLIELLVRHNADINARRHVDGKTTLHLLAADSFEHFAVKNFLAYKPDVNAGDNDGNTPLHLAVHTYSLDEVIQDLLDAGADPNKTNFNMETPIHMIQRSFFSHPNAVQIMVNAGADLEARDSLGRTALLRLVHEVRFSRGSPHSPLDSIQKLLELGAKVYARDINGSSVLHPVCQKLGSPDLLRHLIDAGADPKWLNYEGNTLLHEASSVSEVNWGENQRERLRFLETLLELGVPLRQTKFSGATALHITCSTTRESSQGGNGVWKGIIDLLTGPKFEIGINEGDKNGIRAIHLAANLSEKLVGLLVERGADPGVLTREGQTPLQVACRARQTNVVGQLLELYQSQNLSHLIDWKDKRGRSALHDAARSGRPETVKLLLDAGADPNMQDCEGFTPLHVCSEFELEKILWSSQRRDQRRGGIRKAANVLIGDNERPTGELRCPQMSMWTDIRSEHDTARIRASIRLLLARGADVGARSQLGWTPLDNALSVGCEVMVGELLPARKKAFEKGEIQPLNGRGADSFRNPFTEQYLSLRSKHSPGILRDLVKKNDKIFSEWNKLLRLDDELVIDELINLQVDFSNKGSQGESFLGTLVRWGYGTHLEKLAPQVSMFHEHMSKESDVGRTTGMSFEPLLHIACRRELPNMEVVMILVDKLGVDVNARSVSRGGSRSESGQTALHVLAKGQYWWQKGAVQFLLRRGADIEMKNEKGESPLSLCVTGSITDRRSAIADVLLKHGANPNSVSNDGLTCLNKAGTNSEMVRKLVKHGADTSSGDTPALFTAIAGHDLATVAAILESGAACNARRKADNDDISKWAVRDEVRIPATEVTPLHYAASLNVLRFTGNAEHDRESALPVVRLLLEKGADPYQVCDGDKTVVHHLLEFGGIVQPFHELPTLNLEHRDHLGMTLLLAACRSSFDGLVTVRARKLNETEPTLASILYGMGADIMARDSKGMNAFHHLLRSGPLNSDSYMETFSVFIKDAPLLVHQKDVDGNTPLHYALRMQRVWSVETLLSAGADPLEPDSSCNTALHHLAKVTCADPRRSEQTQLFKKFLALGVPINAKNKAGETPLFDYIAVSDHKEINLRSRTLRDDLTIFKEAGADFLARNNDMESVLHIAAKKSTMDAGRKWKRHYDGDYNKEHPVDRFRFLMDLGCDPLAEDINQRTALDVAAACGNQNILKLFQRGEESKLASNGGSDLLLI